MLPQLLFLFSQLQAPSPAPRVWRSEWNTHVAVAIERHGRELLDPTRLPRREIATLCPGFARASADEKKAFWALFFEAVARYESDFDPGTRFQEGWRDPDTGKPQQSQGLLQLSYSDRHGHPDCRLDRAAGNITDPETNLACGVAILRRQLAVRKTLFPAPRPYYWSVLTTPKAQQRVRDYVVARAARLAACRAQKISAIRLRFSAL